MSNSSVQLVVYDSLALAQIKAQEKGGFKYENEANWLTTQSVPKMTDDESLLYANTSKNNYVRLFLTADERALVRMQLAGGGISVTVFTKTLELGTSTVLDLMETYPVSEPLKDGAIGVRFWTLGGMGARSYNRRITVPEWSEIEANYPSLTGTGLAHLMNGYEAKAEGGKLILWHGVPGTGKTYALRALAAAWSDWCDLHYIIDPDQFFGGSAEYLFSVVLGEEDAVEIQPSVVDGKPPQERWKLIVCEDTGELLSSDAKQQTGQALGRFLNLCDGLVGQGLNIQILVTTNQELNHFHPAVTRNGRVLSNIKFDRFSHDVAKPWLSTHGFDGLLSESSYSLAEMFALAAGEDLVSSQGEIGF